MNTVRAYRGLQASEDVSVGVGELLVERCEMLSQRGRGGEQGPGDVRDGSGGATRRGGELGVRHGRGGCDPEQSMVASQALRCLGALVGAALMVESSRRPQGGRVVADTCLIWLRGSQSSCRQCCTTKELSDPKGGG
jgi:hypothetical protein